MTSRARWHRVELRYHMTPWWGVHVLGMCKDGLQSKTAACTPNCSQMLNWSWMSERSGDTTTVSPPGLVKSATRAPQAQPFRTK